MSEPRNIRDYARKDMIAALMTWEHHHGQAETGVMLEGLLEGISIYLTGSVGNEAAFNVLQRHTDNVAGDVLEAVARS